METVDLSIDELGKILFYNNRVFRAINDNYIDQVKDMFNSGLIEEITNKNLFPKTWVSDISIDGYSLVLEHEKIIHWNYPYEWSFNMLKDAGLVILEVNKIAKKYGYQIKDGHAYNVVFNMNKAQYVDFGSFIKIDSEKDQSWISYSLFYNRLYTPLFLWSKGYQNIARNIFLMRSNNDEFEFYKIKHPVLSFIGRRKLYTFFNNIRRVSLSSRSNIIEKINHPIKQKLLLIIHYLFKNYFSIIKLEDEIKSFIKPAETSMWSDYHNTIDFSRENTFIRIIEIINDLKDAKSLIELASNQGKFAELILKSTHIEKVIGTDYDKEAVDIMYTNNKNRDNFLPLLFDMVRTNGRKCDEYLYKRIKSDVVLALAVTHHLLLSQDISIDFIFKTMKKLTSKYIIVEFMPLGLYSGDLDNIPPLPNFYKVEWFRDNFVKYFDLILDEKLEVNRHVFVGKLKSIK